MSESAILKLSFPSLKDQRPPLIKHICKVITIPEVDWVTFNQDPNKHEACHLSAPYCQLCLVSFTRFRNNDPAQFPFDFKMNLYISCRLRKTIRSSQTTFWFQMNTTFINSFN
ncbi:hypothetical protein ATANTOWER_015082 [Ataeniobius toweri]|uniref:Uncharacterized protein n=1 Tax=Ataeniobius toweri TaxID=208326 RepID=A0ABU7AH56_9TELE|nr:hypothetical protein [Ataeniobius toweri]